MSLTTEIIEQKSWYRYVLYVLLVAAAGAAGFYQGKGHTLTVVKEIKGETVTKTVTQIVTVTKIVRPDGTVEETTTTKNEDKSQDTKTVDRDTSSKSVGTNYSLGVRYRVNSFQSMLTPSVTQAELEMGKRLLGDFWLTGGAGLGGVTLGVRFDF